MMLRQATAVLVLAGTLAACHHEPLINTGERPAGVGGTISGLATSAGGAALSARKVAAINTTTGARFEQSTAVNGGYTIQVPAGTYRLELEVRAGETIATQPDPTEVNVGDLDAQRDFVVTAR
jgi:hypothetical protein